MNASTYSQKFEITLTTRVSGLDLTEKLDVALSELAGDYVGGDYSIDRAAEVVREGPDFTERNAKLLTLKGWLYGEHLKQLAGLPSEWNQGVWANVQPCGTSCCIAGKTVIEAGGKLVTADGIAAVGVGNVEWVLMPGESHPTYISQAAQELLGLDGDQRGALFSGSNTYEHASAIIDAIIADEDAWAARNKVDRRHGIDF